MRRFRGRAGHHLTLLVVPRTLPVVPRTLLICALLVAIYYLAPVEPDAAGSRLVFRAALACLGVGLVALLITRLMIRLLRDDTGTGGGVVALSVALFAGLMVFAFLDYLVAVSYPEQFTGLTTKTDGLYFAVTTLATVGYGDVYAVGQSARVVVIVQQLFNLAVLATGATVLVNHLASRNQPSRSGAPPSSGIGGGA